MPAKKKAVPKDGEPTLDDATVAVALRSATEAVLDTAKKEGLTVGQTAELIRSTLRVSRKDAISHVLGWSVGK